VILAYTAQCFGAKIQSKYVKYNYIPIKGRDFSLHHYVQTTCGAHAISYPMSTRNKVAAVCTVSGPRTALPYP